MDFLEFVKRELRDILRNEDWVGTLYDYGLLLPDRVRMRNTLTDDEVERVLLTYSGEVYEYVEHAENDLGVFYEYDVNYDAFTEEAYRMYEDMLGRACMIVYTSAWVVHAGMLSDPDKVYEIAEGSEIVDELLRDIDKVNSIVFEEIW